MAMKAAKNKIIFRCQQCGHSSQKWLGKCPECSEWNSLVEEVSMPEGQAHRSQMTHFTSEVSRLSDVKSTGFDRMQTGIREFDQMIGGGIVPGSLILLGGAPGIGKSTLMMQLAARLATDKKVLYVSGEESREQIKSRADRLKVSADQLYLLSETSLENMLQAISTIDPQILIIDSIQTTYRSDIASAPGSVSQVRECAAEFLRSAKSSNRTVFLLGHVTKEGDLAGPRVLEHIVDTVLYFENERSLSYRILRAVKNRFGPTSEIGMFEMTSKGLEEVSNPSQIFLSEHRKVPGCVLVAAMEGTRPMLLEIQALTSRTLFGLPRRMVTGVDFNRVVLLTAVLEKWVGLNLQNHDIFVNVTGGVKLKEPAADLGIACAMASAFGNFSPQTDGVLIGEVGLSGEIRSVGQVLERLKEAERMGLAWAIVPKRSLKEKFVSSSLKVIAVETLEEVIQQLRA